MKHKPAILFVQLGTPEAPTKKSLKKYLKEFLSDKRVVDLAPILWKMILHFSILRKRPQKSAELYKEIWTDEGSPLRVITEKQVAYFKDQVKEDVSVEYAMRYGSPSIREKLIEFKFKEVDQIYIVPLYPQYSSSTTGSVVEEVYKTIQHFRYIPSVKICDPFYLQDFYIDGFIRNIRKAFKEKLFDYLLLSYHGIPKRYATLGDPYNKMCRATTDRITEKLGDTSYRIIHCYQSRFGKEEWLKPYTDVATEVVSGEIAVVSPSFVSDCLETTHELGIELKIDYENGELTLIPCLNDEKQWLEGFKDYIKLDAPSWNLFR